MTTFKTDNNEDIKIPDEINNAPSPHEIIREAVHNLKPYWNINEWIDPANPFKKFKACKIKKPLPEEDNKHRHMVEYIAASILHHCFDGWTYLGRAIEAIMAGDPISARHLGYYAELRGAMSILAYEGIGVFSNKHVVVHGIDKCEVIINRGNTHKFTKNALKYLDDLGRSHIMLKVVKLHNYSLDDWLSGISPVRIKAPAGRRIISGSLLNKLGVDIEELFDLDQDHSARNTASYRPSIFELDDPEPIDRVVDFLKYLWHILQPSPNSEGRFEVLDQQLLLYCTALAVGNIHGDQISISDLRKKYENETSKMMNSLSISENTQRLLKDTALKADLIQPPPQIPNSRLLEYAFGDSPPSNAIYPLELLTRATLMLRIATGCVETLLDPLGSDRRDTLEFWWSGPAVRRRLWPENDRPESFYDLRIDIDLALDNVDDWMESTASETICYHNIWKTCAADLSTLSTTERVFLWGIGL